MRAFKNYYIYPQYIWAQEIDLIFKSGIIKEIGKHKIIDAPCGNGVISYWLKRKNCKIEFLLCDIDVKAMNLARKNIKGIKYFTQDIFNLNTGTSNNIWLLINSLFCLPEAEKLIKLMSGQMEYIIGVFPYIDHVNYKTFLSANPRFLNPSASAILSMIEPEEDFIWSRNL